MVEKADMRIAVVMGVEPGAGDAVLAEEGYNAPAGVYVARFAMAGQAGDVPGCACCTPRGPAAEALTAMFRARATGAAPFFARVVVLASPTGQAAVAAALAEDVVARARFRTGKNFSD